MSDNSTPKNLSTIRLSAALIFSFYRWRGETTRNKKGGKDMSVGMGTDFYFFLLFYSFPLTSLLFSVVFCSLLQCESGWSQWQHDIMETQSPTLTPSKWTLCSMSCELVVLFCFLPLFNQIKAHWDQDLFRKGDLAKKVSSTRHNSGTCQHKLQRLTDRIKHTILVMQQQHNKQII